MHLVTIGGFNTAIEATREFKSILRVDVCVKTVMNTLQEVGLEFVEKVFKRTFSARNVKEAWILLKCTKIGQYVIGREWF